MRLSARSSSGVVRIPLKKRRRTGLRWAVGIGSGLALAAGAFVLGTALGEGDGVDPRSDDEKVAAMGHAPRAVAVVPTIELDPPEAEAPADPDPPTDPADIELSSRSSKHGARQHHASHDTKPEAAATASAVKAESGGDAKSEQGGNDTRSLIERLAKGTHKATGKQEGGLGGLDSDARLPSGSTYRDTVRRLIRSRLSGVKWCFQRAVQRDRSAKANIKLRIPIREDGHVDHPRVAKSTLKDDGVIKCIEGKMQDWRFPTRKSGGTVVVSYPVSLVAN